MGATGSADRVHRVERVCRVLGVYTYISSMYIWMDLFVLLWFVTGLCWPAVWGKRRGQDGYRDDRKEIAHYTK